MNSKTEVLLERTFLFGVDTLNLLLKLPDNKVYSIFEIGHYAYYLWRIENYPFYLVPNGT